MGGWTRGWQRCWADLEQMGNVFLHQFWSKWEKWNVFPELWDPGENLDLTLKLRGKDVILVEPRRGLAALWGAEQVMFAHIADSSLNLCTHNVLRHSPTLVLLVDHVEANIWTVAPSKLCGHGSARMSPCRWHSTKHQQSLCEWLWCGLWVWFMSIELTLSGYSATEIMIALSRETSVWSMILLSIL